MAKSAAKNFVWLFTFEILGHLVGFVIIIYLARILTASGFGVYSFAQAFLLYLLLLVDGGFSVLGAREIARDKASAGIFGVNILLIRFLLTIVILFVSITTVMLLDISGWLKLLFIFTFIFIFPRAINPEWIFQGLEKMQFIGTSRFFQQLLILIVIVMFVRGPNNLLSVPLIYFFCALLTSLVLLVVLNLYFDNLKFINLKFGQWKKYFKQALPMGASFIFIQIYYNLDTIMLGFIKNPETVGWYNAAYKIVLFLISLGALFGYVIFPVISRYYHESQEKLKTLITLSAKLTAIFAFPLGFGGTLLAGPLMILLYGNSYLPGVIGLQILIWSVVTVYLNIPFAYLLLGSDRQNQYLYSVLTGAVINFVFNLLLIPSWGLVGAGLATMLSEIVVVSMLYFYSRSVLRVQVKEYIFKAVAASIVMTLVLYYINLQNVLVNILIGIVLYFAACILFKLIKKDDLLLLKEYLFGG